MKSLIEYLNESYGSSFKETFEISMNQFNKWKKKHEKDNNLEILYSEADAVYAIYLLKDKSSIKWNGEHIGTYNCKDAKFFCDKLEYFDGLIDK